MKSDNPETIDRGDPRFLSLLCRIYEVWEEESKQLLKFDWNVDRIRHCLMNFAHGEELTSYCRDMIEQFSEEGLLRILNKHILLRELNAREPWHTAS